MLQPSSTQSSRAGGSGQWMTKTASGWSEAIQLESLYQPTFPRVPFGVMTT
jgi:hypothetical protein